jgi:uncharacterized protein YraI
MRFKALLGSAAAAAATVALVAGGAGTADAATRVTSVGASAATYTVTAYTDVNVRAYPSTQYGKVQYTLRAGQSAAADCWALGQTISAHGYTNNVWIQLHSASSQPLYVSAVYLKGNNFANLPGWDICG